MSLKFLNIAPLLIENIGEINADIVGMFRENVITDNAFSMTLVPEGDPVIDKAAELGRRFVAFRAGLKELAPELPVGILLQATLGHGWTPDEPAAFGRFHSFDGRVPYIFCPLDPDFREYVANQVRSLAHLNPDFFMLDDDFRMITGRGGCFCPRHIAEYNRRYGTMFSQEELMSLVTTDGEIARQYDALQLESLAELAKIIRSAINACNPNLFCSFCACGYDVRHAPFIARILAGHGQKPQVRINNARYLTESLRDVPSWLSYTATQMAAFPPDIELLAEPDTFPQNRYATSAAVLHQHLACSILHGCRGGKLWLTRMHFWEPESGFAYRRKLAEQHGFYEACSSLAIQWEGPVIPIADPPFFNFPDREHGRFNWGSEIFGKMGIPFQFSTRKSNVVTTLTVPDIRTFSEEQLEKIFQGKVLLDGSAAQELAERGHQDWIGFDACKWSSANATFEEISSGKRIAICGGRPVEFFNLAPGAVALSYFFHLPFECSPDARRLSPGSIRYHNHLGGEVVSLALPVLPFHYGSIVMLNQTSKKRLIELLQSLGAIKFYYPGDAEVLLLHGRDHGREFLFLLNIGLDTLDEIELAGPAISQLSMLTPQGNWSTLPHTQKNAHTTILHHLLPPLSPLLLELH